MYVIQHTGAAVGQFNTCNWTKGDRDSFICSGGHLQSKATSFSVIECVNNKNWLLS